jgi:hypothetical protein
MKMKVLSPVIRGCAEVERLHFLENKKISVDMVRRLFLCRGLSPQHGDECNLQKPERSKRFLLKKVFTDNLKRRGCENSCLEVGLLRSRGVIRVTPCEGQIHSKGVALVCRDGVKHGPDKELG